MLIENGSFRAAGKYKQGSKRGREKRSAQRLKTIQQIFSRLIKCISRRIKILYSIDEISVEKMISVSVCSGLERYSTAGQVLACMHCTQLA